MPRTKIVATIGPASNKDKIIGKMLDAGLSVARVNFSHGDRESVTEMVTRLRRVAKKKGKILAILGDLQGPKLRLGKLSNDGREVTEGETITLTPDGANDTTPFPHPELYEAMKPGARLVLGDGEVEFQVVEQAKNRLVCTVIVDGFMGSRKGVNMPGTTLPIPSVTEKDKIDLATACELEMDYVAMSFVRSAEDVHELRSYLSEYGGGNIPIISKIEKFEAIENLEAIRDASYGLMVARGDLGIDVEPYEVPFLQKRIIASCNEAGKPVITATQMLQSMVESPVPTRAEATDVANAILDGTSAVMLSNETAMGNYPVKSVKMMANIARIAEENFPYDDWERRRREELWSNTNDASEAISSAACSIATLVEAKAIVTTTVSGSTARKVARFHPSTPIIALTPSEKTQRRLNLVWGVTTLMASRFDSMEEMIEEAASRIAEQGGCGLGDRIVITAGVPFNRAGLTNLIQVHVFTEEDFLD